MVTDGTGSAEDVKRLNAGTIIKFGDKKAFRESVQNTYNNPKPFFKKESFCRKKLYRFSIRTNIKLFSNMISKLV